jgi:hypothetical protein
MLLQRLRDVEANSLIGFLGAIFFSLTINGLANIRNASADLSEQLAGA